MQVNAAGVNRLDLIQVSGRYPPPQGESDILGVEGERTETLALAHFSSVHKFVIGCYNVLSVASAPLAGFY